MKRLGKVIQNRFNNAVKAELRAWRVDQEGKSRMMAFAALVGMRLNGENVEAFVNNSRDPTPSPAVK